MADIAPQPFINYGLSQAQQGQATAAAGLETQQAGLVSQQAQSAQMNNQIQRATMPLILQTIQESQADMSGANPGNPEAGQGKIGAPGGEGGGPAGPATTESGVTPSWYNSDSVEDAFRQQNYIQPWTDQELQMLKYGTALSMSPNNAAAGAAIVARVQTQRQARIDNQTAQNQLRMGNTYDASAAVHNRDPDGDQPGSTFAMLAATDKPAAAGIRSAATDANGNFNAAAADALARQYSGHIAAVSHIYAGRPTDMVNNQLVDKATGQAVVGQAQLFVGSTPEQRGNDRQFALTPIPVKFTDGTTQDMPRWKAPVDQGGFGGKVTPDQYMLQQDRARRIQPNNPDGSPAIPDVGGPPVRPPQVAPKPATGSALAAVNANSPSALAAATSGPVPPTGTPQYARRVQAALADPAYRAPYDPDTMPHVEGAPKPAVQQEMDQYLKQRNDAQQEFSDHASAASQALMNFRAAQAILTAPDGSNIHQLGITGPIGGIFQRVAALGFSSDTADKRMEAAKYLTNGAVQNIRQMYGARPAMFDVKLNVEKAFPNLDTMDVDSAQALIQSQIAQSQYMRDSSLRGNAYITKGNDPMSFNSWNEKYFPRENMLVPGGGQGAGVPGAGQPDVTQAQHAALAQGAPFYWKGQLHHKGVD